MMVMMVMMVIYQLPLPAVDVQFSNIAIVLIGVNNVG